jgi:hypothetical protein
VWGGGAPGDLDLLLALGDAVVGELHHVCLVIEALTGIGLVVGADAGVLELTHRVRDRRRIG